MADLQSVYFLEKSLLNSSFGNFPQFSTVPIWSGKKIREKRENVRIFSEKQISSFKNLSLISTIVIKNFAKK
jgi:hypothetical protein